MDTWNVLNVYATEANVFLGFFGQFLFLLLFATRPWRKNKFASAIMYKSAAFGLYLFRNSVIVIYRWPLEFHDPWWLALFSITINVVVLAAIWWQFYRLFGEIRAAAHEVPSEYHPHPQEGA